MGRKLAVKLRVNAMKLTSDVLGVLYFGFDVREEVLYVWRRWRAAGRHLRNCLQVGHFTNSSRGSVLSRISATGHALCQHQLAFDVSLIGRIASDTHHNEPLYFSMLFILFNLLK